MCFKLLYIWHVICRCLLPEHVLEHGCKLLDILLLLLHICIIRHILRQLLALLWGEIELLCPEYTLLHCLIACRQALNLLGYRAIQILRAFFYYEIILLIELKRSNILYISA